MAQDHFVGYHEELTALRERWLDYLMVVSIETMAVCNAACEFCPYPIMEHKGARMTDDQFEKILADLSRNTGKYPWLMSLARVNEPFIDKRIFGFYRRINELFPRTMIFFHTNASSMNEANFNKLLELKRVSFLKVSLNAHTAADYQKVMKLPFDRTIENLRTMHRFAEEGRIKFPVTLGRVGDKSHRDDEFLEWCRAEFPLFKANITPRGDWMGLITADKFSVPDVGCKQWFELHVLANGNEAFCCIDADGRYGNGNAFEMDALDLYNRPLKRKLRETLPSRKDVRTCSVCPMLS